MQHDGIVIQSCFPTIALVVYSTFLLIAASKYQAAFFAASVFMTSRIDCIQVSILNSTDGRGTGPSGESSQQIVNLAYDYAQIFF